MHRRIHASIMIALAALAVFVCVFVARPFGHQLSTRAYFANGMGLRAGAPVRLAGVDIGSVKGVRPHPELKQMPVEVQMVIRTPYELNIPNDSTASLETAGVLGETFVEIDSVAASGPPLRQNEVLKSKTTNAVSVEQIIKNFGDKIRMKDCGCEKPATGPDVKSRPQTDVPR